MRILDIVLASVYWYLLGLDVLRHCNERKEGVGLKRIGDKVTKLRKNLRTYRRFYTGILRYLLEMMTMHIIHPSGKNIEESMVL